MLQSIKSLDKKGLLDILEENNILKSDGKPYDMSHKIMVLQNAIKRNLSRIKEEEVLDIAKYQVRYVGYNGQVDMNENSTKSGLRYLFPKGAWIDVEIMDWNHFHKKVEKSVAKNIDPHWEVRKITVLDKVVSFFMNEAEKIRLKKPDGLHALPGMNEHRYRILINSDIRSIRQFMGIPPEWMIDKLKLERHQYFSMKDAAQRSFT